MTYIVSSGVLNSTHSLILIQSKEWHGSSSWFMVPMGFYSMGIGLMFTTTSIFNSVVTIGTKNLHTYSLR